MGSRESHVLHVSAELQVLEVPTHVSTSANIEFPAQKVVKLLVDCQFVGWRMFYQFRHMKGAETQAT